MIPRSAFVTATAFDQEFVRNYVMALLLFRPFLSADIARTTWTHPPQCGQ